MTVKVQLKLGRRSITAEGDSRPQAQARALAAYRKKHGENAKGASFEVISADKKKATREKTAKKATAKKDKAKPRTDNPAPAPAETARPAAGGRAAGGRKRKREAAEEKPARPKTESARLPDVARLAPRDRIVLGWSGRTPSEAALLPASAPIKAAKALAETPSFGGTHRQVLVVDRTYEASPVPRSLGAGRVDLDALRSGDRLVVALDATGRVIEVHPLSGERSLEEARALAGSDRVGGRYRFTATVHSTYRR
ncbi:MAG: hypothetical protein H6701_05480 [Myxococcales bacterium]|nr:hypothetical protein [Myxococcales bacterium]